MGELINLFQQRHAEALDDEEEWPSGLPLTFTEIAEFLQLAESMVAADNDPERFAAVMAEIQERVAGWNSG